MGGETGRELLDGAGKPSKRAISRSRSKSETMRDQRSTRNRQARRFLSSTGALFNAYSPSTRSIVIRALTRPDRRSAHQSPGARWLVPQQPKSNGKSGGPFESPTSNK
jgi:hypothetical protein